VLLQISLTRKKAKSDLSLDERALVKCVFEKNLSPNFWTKLARINSKSEYGTAISVYIKAANISANYCTIYLKFPNLTTIGRQIPVRSKVN